MNWVLLEVAFLPRTVAFTVLGCKVNQYEVEAFRGFFTRAGYAVVGEEEGADVHVIHTCTVTNISDRKSRQAIRRASRVNPEALIVVSGCYAQVAPGEAAALEGVDLVIGTRERASMVDLVEKAFQDRNQVNVATPSSREWEFEELPLEMPSKTRAFVKIEEGCDRFCSYCVVPYARGPVRSRDPETTLAEVSRLVEAGFKEVVLTGVHIGAYGKDLPGDITLSKLIARIFEAGGPLRLRISSIDPDEFTPELLQLVAAEKSICPHFHIPLQSGNDAVLRQMRRHYSSGEYRQLVTELRKLVPGVAISTDVMVGFPGETEAQHGDSLEFVRELAIMRLHVFSYSTRAGTLAARFPEQVPSRVKQSRSREFGALGRELAAGYVERFLGHVLPVLVEGKRDELWEGLTANYIRVKFEFSGGQAGELVPVRLVSWHEGIAGGVLV